MLLISEQEVLKAIRAGLKCPQFALFMDSVHPGMFVLCQVAITGAPENGLSAGKNGMKWHSK